MRKLNGIINGFNKVVKKLDKLAETNGLQIDVLTVEIADKQMAVSSLRNEATKAKSISEKIANLVS